MKDSAILNQDASLMTLTEVATYLKVADKTVSRMLQRGEIPAVKVANQWRFSRARLDEWLMTGMRSAASDALTEMRAESAVPRSLSRLIPDGCIVTGLTAEPKADLLARLTAPLVGAGLVTDGNEFVRQLLAREAILPTAVGDGIALPHARDPQAPAGRYGLAIGTSQTGIDFDAPDGRPVYIFVVLCADSVPHHLAMMVQVALALREARVVRAVRDARAPCDVLAALIEHDQRRLFGNLAKITPEI